MGIFVKVVLKNGKATGDKVKPAMIRGVASGTKKATDMTIKTVDGDDPVTENGKKPAKPTDPPEPAEGYVVRLTISIVKPDGARTYVEVTGEYNTYNKDGEKVVGLNLKGHGYGDGSDSVPDVAEAVIESIMEKQVVPTTRRLSASSPGSGSGSGSGSGQGP